MPLKFSQVVRKNGVICDLPKKMTELYVAKPPNPGVKRLRNTKHKQTVTENVTVVMIIDI